MFGYFLWFVIGICIGMVATLIMHKNEIENYDKLKSLDKNRIDYIDKLQKSREPILAEISNLKRKLKESAQFTNSLINQIKTLKEQNARKY